MNMKGFKPTGYGPSSGFKFPSRMGFTGSTGHITTVSPYTRRKFASGGFVRQDNPRMQEDSIGDQGSALVRRARSSTALDQESGGKTPIRPGFKRGGACMSDGGNWIAGATKNKGALHRALGVPEGQKIPAKKLAKAAHSDNPKMRKRAALAKTLGKMHKADGGDVKLPRRKTPYTFGQSLRAVPEFVGTLPSMIKDAIVDAGRRKLSDVQQDVADTKRRRIDSIVDADAGNYARGGKAKRMGYQGGGLSTMFGRVLAQKANNQRPPVTQQMIMSRAPRVLMRSSGGKAKRMGYANGGRRDGLVTERAPPPPPKKEPTTPAKPFPPAATIKEKFYARGGGVSVKQAKEIAERTIGDHVRYPAPKGHKGLEKVMRRN